MKRILVVEDDPSLSFGLEDFFKSEGFIVTTSGRTSEARNLIFERNFDIIILDLMLPGGSGLEILREIRSEGIRTPVIILTAKGEEDDKILGLMLGADDYVTKPFSMRELGARVTAVLRRTETYKDKKEKPLPRFYIENIYIDLPSFEIVKGRKHITLSSTEARMLEILYHANGGVVSRMQFIDKIWGEDSLVGTRTIDTHILNLRKKLEKNPSKPKYLLTVRGEGYKLVGIKEI